MNGVVEGKVVLPIARNLMSVPHAINHNSFEESVKETFPGCPILGTTAAGEICDGDSLDNTTILSFSRFENITVKTALLERNDDLFEGGGYLEKELNTSEIKLAILFGCGIKNDGAINDISAPLTLANFKQALVQVA